jgi:hypothetical protein
MQYERQPPGRQGTAIASAIEVGRVRLPDFWLKLVVVQDTQQFPLGRQHEQTLSLFLLAERGFKRSGRGYMMIDTATTECTVVADIASERLRNR